MGLCQGRRRERWPSECGAQKKKARKRNRWATSWPFASGGIYAPLGPITSSVVAAPVSQGIAGGQASYGGTASNAPQVNGGAAGTKFGGLLAQP